MRQLTLLLIAVLCTAILSNCSKDTDPFPVECNGFLSLQYWQLKPGTDPYNVQEEDFVAVAEEAYGTCEDQKRYYLNTTKIFVEDPEGTWKLKYSEYMGGDYYYKDRTGTGTHSLIYQYPDDKKIFICDCVEDQ